MKHYRILCRQKGERYHEAEGANAMRRWFVGLALLTLPLAAGCADQEQASGDQTLAPGASAAVKVTAAPTSPAGAAASVQPTGTGTPASSVTPPKKTSAPPVKASPNGKNQTANLQSGVRSVTEAKRIIEVRSQAAVTALQKKDWAALSGYVHPDKGLHISPSCYVDTKKDQVFPKDQTAKFDKDGTVRTWGSYDGSGEPIKLTASQFYDQILYNHDYAKPEKTGYNESWGKSNTVNNIRDTYPDAIVVEYYFGGFDAKLKGIDWASLSLVFEEKAGEWYLTGMVRNQWTI
jgi:hypothetical protein